MGNVCTKKKGVGRYVSHTKCGCTHNCLVFYSIVLKLLLLIRKRSPCFVCVLRVASIVCPCLSRCVYQRIFIYLFFLHSRKLTLAIVGLDNAGKTVTTNGLRGGESITK